MACADTHKLLLAGSQASVTDILAIAGDTLGDLLDKQQGHTVTDKDIYRCSDDSMLSTYCRRSLQIIQMA